MNFTGRILLLILQLTVTVNRICAGPVQGEKAFTDIIPSADSLFRQQQYAHALIEYYRQIHSNETDTSDFAFIFGRIGYCNYKLDNFSRADSFFLISDSLGSPASDSCNRRISIAVLMLQKGQLGYAGRWINKCGSSADSQKVDLIRKTVLLFSGKKVIETTTTENVPDTPDLLTDTLLSALLHYQKCTLEKNYNRKLIPGAASALIPGTGQMLTGNFGSGINSLLVTGVCAGIGIWAYKKNNIALLTPAVLLSFNFYKGSIYHAVRYAENKLKTEAYTARETITHCIDKLFTPQRYWEAP